MMINDGDLTISHPIANTGKGYSYWAFNGRFTISYDHQTRQIECTLPYPLIFLDLFLEIIIATRQSG